MDQCLLSFNIVNTINAKFLISAGPPVVSHLDLCDRFDRLCFVFRAAVCSFVYRQYAFVSARQKYVIGLISP